MKDKVYTAAHICLFIAVFVIGNTFCIGEIPDISGVIFGTVLAIILCSVLHVCVSICISRNKKKPQRKTILSFNDREDIFEVEPIRHPEFIGRDISCRVEYLKQIPDIPLTLGADGSIFVNDKLVLVDKRFYNALFDYLIEKEKDVS